MGRYAKTVVAGVLGGAYALQAALSDDVVTNTEWVGIGMAVLIALGVWAVPNSPAASDAQDTRLH
jgi:hypothetical protein